MGIEEYLENRRLWQEKSVWLRMWGISYAFYDAIPDKLKDILHSCICTPTKPTTDRQRTELAQYLITHSSSFRGTSNADTQSMEMLKDQLLRPITEEEKEDFFSKF